MSISSVQKSASENMGTITFKSSSDKKMNLLIRLALEMGIEIVVPDLDEEDLRWLLKDRKKKPAKKKKK